MGGTRRKGTAVFVLISVNAASVQGADLALEVVTLVLGNGWSASSVENNKHQVQAAAQPESVTFNIYLCAPRAQRYPPPSRADQRFSASKHTAGIPTY